MPQVPNRHFVDILDEYIIPYIIVDSSWFKVPQRRRRIMVGEPHFIENLEETITFHTKECELRKSRTPRDIFEQMHRSGYPVWTGEGKLPSIAKLQFGTDNTPIRKNGITIGHRPLLPGENARSLDVPAPTITRKPLKVVVNDEFAGVLTWEAHAGLQCLLRNRHFARDLAGLGITAARLAVANAIPPPLAVAMISSALRLGLAWSD